MIKTIAMLALMTALSACAAKTEMPSNGGTDSDVMRPSPCACQELEYDDGGFQWLG